MDSVANAYASLSDLNLWIKVSEEDNLTLADLPALIKLRYQYIIENWETIKAGLIRSINRYYDPARFQEEIGDFDSVVISVRNRGNKIDNLINVNALLSKYFTVFDNLLVSDINTTSQEAIIIQNEKTRVLAFTKQSFLDIRTSFTAGRDTMADSIGGSDEDYNKVYNRASSPVRLTKVPKYIVLAGQLQNGIESVNAILVNSKSILSSTAIIDPFAFARANANNPDIDIRSFKSGRLIRMNYGESLQTLALRTMGNQDRWLEIAIANGLKPPYVDEIGQSLSLIANANGNTINIGPTDTQGHTNKEKLSLNQIVILQSDVERSPDQRLIVSFREIPVSGELVIELDGPPDLDKYKTADFATIRVFQKNTINSNFYVLIPSTEEVPQDITDEVPWFLRSKAKDERQTGVDLYLSDTNDIALTSGGDLQLSYGVGNALQALKILLGTEQGTVRRHPTYGINAPIGAANTNPEVVRRSIAQSISNQILNDHRFDRLDHLTVEYTVSKGSAASGYLISVGAVLSGGGNNVIPITFTINVSRSSDGG